MSPARIVKRAREKQLDIIGICDHNSAENVVATKNAARKTNIAILAGMEVTTAEEVHIIAFFDKTDDVLQLQTIVYEHLNPGENKEELFGEQIIANEFDEVQGYSRRLLIGATTLTVQDVVQHIHNLGGLAIASHVDRESFSIIGQLGFIPDNLELDAVEISMHMDRSRAVAAFPELGKFSIICSSDAHLLQDIGVVTTSFYLEKPTVGEIRKAFYNEGGRKIIMEAGG